MTGSAVQFDLAIAGIRFRISCDYPSTKEFCREYLTQQGNSGEMIRIDAAMRRHERESYPAPESDAAVEIQCLCREVAERLPMHGAVLFHSSALSFDGQGVLFTAPSGTGKSTHTGFWRRVFGQRVEMVNDDKPVLRLTGEGAVVYGSPWRGKHRIGKNIQATLKAICFLRRGTENRVEAMTKQEAYSLILQQVYRPEQPEMLLKTLSLVEQLCDCAERNLLTCNMDPEAAITACRGIFGEDARI